MNATTSGAGTGQAAHGVRPRDVADLAVTASYPCISVLLPTEPAPRMTASDAARLQALVDDVDRQLRDQAVPSRARLMHKLADRVRQAAGRPTDRAVAIYVSLAVNRTFWLSTPVTARGVVERTFATRPLINSLHRTPPHVLLVLHATCAHLYQGSDGALRLVDSREVFGERGWVRVPSQGAVGRATAADLADDFLVSVDQMLGSHRADHPSPLVLGGSPRVVDRFCTLSRNMHRLAGRLPPEQCETASGLASSATTAVERYLRSRREEALLSLRDALESRPGDVASGMAACWRAVHQRLPGMLLVEQDFVIPGRPEDFGVSVPGAAPRSGLPAAHDLVDDLIEVVFMRGGQLALVENGDLADHGRVVLLNRRDRRTPPPDPR